MKTCFITKVKLWNLLGAESLNFASWLLSGTPDANVFKLIFDSITDTFDINDSLIHDILLPKLVTENVISQVTIDKINAFINIPTFVGYQQDSMPAKVIVDETPSLIPVQIVVDPIPESPVVDAGLVI